MNVIVAHAAAFGRKIFEKKLAKTMTRYENSRRLVEDKST
jgi:hypothetical protein